VSDEKVNWAKAINLALDDAMAADQRVIVFGEDVADPEGGGIRKATLGLSTKYGARVRTTPIAEQAIIGAAVGAAVAGLRPVAELMLMNFSTVAMDQLTNHAAKLRFMSGGQTSVPMTVRTTSGTGRSLGGQHADMLEAWFAHTPGIKVVAPANAHDAYGLLYSCIFDDDPCLFVEHGPSYLQTSPMPERGKGIKLGKAKVVRPGSDVTLIGYSRTVNDSLAAAAALEEDGISAEVIDLRTIVPLDMATILDSVKKTGRAVMVHEAVRAFGVGAEISARISEEGWGDLKAPVQRLGGAFCPIPFAKHLETAFLPSVDDIVGAARATLA
jgi:pyruvate dehydrogenase E1 component beta subunit